MEFQQLTDDTPIYVIARNLTEFNTYVEQQRQFLMDQNYIYVEDGPMLRGRVPGRVVKLDGAKYRWNLQEIEETIAQHKIDIDKNN